MLHCSVSTRRWGHANVLAHLDMPKVLSAGHHTHAPDASPATAKVRFAYLLLLPHKSKSQEGGVVCTPSSINQRAHIVGVPFISLHIGLSYLFNPGSCNQTVSVTASCGIEQQCSSTMYSTQSCNTIYCWTIGCSAVPGKYVGAEQDACTTWYNSKSRLGWYDK